MGMGMGGGGGGGQGPSMTMFNGTSTVTPPEEVLQMYRSINPRAQAAADTPWENYSNNPNDFVAPFNDYQYAGLGGMGANLQTATPFVQNAAQQYNGADQLYGMSDAMAGSAAGQSVANYGAPDAITGGYYNNAMDQYGKAANAPGGLDVGNPYLQGGAGLIGQGGQGTTPVGYNEIQQYESPYQSQVINSTMGLLNQQNEQAMSGSLGNAVKSGAFGGDRAGIAAANLNQQQTLANANVLGGLENQNYAQALGAAQQTRGMNQADLQRQLAAGQALGQIGSEAGQLRNQDLGRSLAAGQQMAGLGTQKYQNYTAQQAQEQQDLSRQMQAAQQYGQNAAGVSNVAQGMGNLGFGLQSGIGNALENYFGAGTALQQTSQAQKDAMYNQWLQQKAYPFMTTQWLADMYGSLGPLYGSTTTSSGTSMSMPMSDPRVKTGVNGFKRGGEADKPEVIGRTFDGQDIYRYSLGGSAPQIGLMADEAAQRDPSTVHHDSHGLMHLDYARATDDAAKIGHHVGANRRDHFAGGGLAGALAAQSQMYAAKKPGQVGPGGNSFVPQGKGGGHGMLTAPPPNVPKAELTQPKPQHAPPDVAGGLEKMKGLAGGKGGLGGLFGSNGLGGAFNTASNATSAATPAAATAETVSATPASTTPAEEFPKATPASTDAAPLPPSRPSDLSTALIDADASKMASDIDQNAADAVDTADASDGLGEIADDAVGLANRGGRINRAVGGVMPFNNNKGAIPFSPNGGSMPFEQGMANNVVPAAVMNDQHHPQMPISQPPDMMKMAGQGGGGGKKGGGEGGKQAEQLMKQGMEQMKGMAEKGQKAAESAPSKITEQATKPVEDVADKTQLANSTEHAANSAENTSQEGLGNVEQAANSAENGANEGLGNIGGDIGNKASEAGSGMQESATEGLGDLGSSMGDAGGGLGDAAGDAGAEMADAAGDGLMGASEDAAAGMGDMAAEAGADAAAAGAEAAAGGGAEGLLGLLPLLLLKRGGRVPRKTFSAGGPDSDVSASDDNGPDGGLAPPPEAPTPNKPIELVKVEEPRRQEQQQPVQVAEASTTKNDATPADDGFNRHVGTVLKVEGGYTPDDAGHGPSNRGINAAAHPGMDIKNISEGQARDIYRKEYWDGAGIGKLPANMQGLAFDASVNQGPGRAMKWAQQAGDDPYKLYKLRQDHYQSLLDQNPGKYSRYANSWNGRLNAQAQLAGIKDISNLQVNGHPARNTGGGPEYLDRSMMASTDGHEQQIGPGAEEGGLGAMDVILPIAAAGLQYAANRKYYGSGPAAAAAISSGLGLAGSMRTAGLEEEKIRHQMQVEDERLRIQQEDAVRAGQKWEAEQAATQREILKRKAQEEAIKTMRQGAQPSRPDEGYGPPPEPNAQPPANTPPQVTPPAPVNPAPKVPAPVETPPPPPQATPKTQIVPVPETPVNNEQQSDGLAGNRQVQPQPAVVKPSNTSTNADRVVENEIEPSKPKVQEVQPAPTFNTAKDKGSFFRTLQDEDNPYYWDAQIQNEKKQADAALSTNSPEMMAEYEKHMLAAREAQAKKIEAANREVITDRYGNKWRNPGLAEQKAEAGALVKKTEEEASQSVRDQHELVDWEPTGGGATRQVTKAEAIRLSKEGKGRMVDENGDEIPVSGYVKKQPEIFAKKQEAIQKRYDEMTQSYLERPKSLNNFKQMAHLLENIETGKWSGTLQEAAARAKALGFDIPDSATVNPAAFQEYGKFSMANVMNVAKDTSNKVLAIELNQIERANPNIEMQPEANRLILGQNIGIANWQNKFYEDYSEWYSKHSTATDDSNFSKKWVNENPLQDYIDDATKNVFAVGSKNPPLEKGKTGVDVPSERRVVGREYPMPDGRNAVWTETKSGKKGWVVKQKDQPSD